MALKDFDLSKISKFSYGIINANKKVGQSYRDGHSEGVVTGVKNVIENKFISSDNSQWPNQELVSGRVGAREASPPQGVGSKDNPQNFIVNNAAGEREITGIQGSITFDGNDDLISKSLIMKTMDDQLSDGTLRSYNLDLSTSVQKGWRQLPIGFRDFGTKSLDAEPIKISGDASFPGFTVIQANPQWTDGHVNNYTDITTLNSWYGRFVNKFVNLSSDQIMRGDGIVGDAFTQFDSLSLPIGFSPGIRAITFGNVVEKPSYTKQVKYVGGTYPFTGRLRYVDSDFEDRLTFNPGDFNGDSDFVPEDGNKMLYLYDKFIMNANEISYGRSFNDIVINSIFGDRYPLVPGQNLIRSAHIQSLETDRFKFNPGFPDVSSVNFYSGERGEDSDEVSQLYGGKNQIYFDGQSRLYRHPLADTQADNQYNVFIYDTLVDKFNDSYNTSAEFTDRAGEVTVTSYVSNLHKQGLEYGKPVGTPSIDDTPTKRYSPFAFFSKSPGQSRTFKIKGSKERELREQNDSTLEDRLSIGNQVNEVPVGEENVHPTLASYVTDRKVGDELDKFAESISIVPGAAGTGDVLPLDDFQTQNSLSIHKTPINLSPMDVYSSLAYPVLGTDDSGDNIDPGGAASLRYEATLRSAGELNQTIDVKLGGSGGDRTPGLESQSHPQGRGARDRGKKLVYNIGRSDHGAVQIVKDEIMNVPGGFEQGAIKVDADGKAISRAATNVDKINAIPYGGDDKQNEAAFNSADKDDFVPLVFYDVFNKKNIVFRAIFDGDITDSVTPEYNPVSAVGRPIKGAVYGGVDRKISFGFQLYPKTKQEFPIMLEKLNYLVGLCYPNLDDYYRMSAPMIKLTLGDIFRRQLGYLSTCTVTFPSESDWEIERGLRFTKLVKVNVDFDYIGGNIPISTGKHYGLGWLDGTKIPEADPVRITNGGNETSVSLPNVGTVFEEAKTMMGSQDV